MSSKKTISNASPVPHFQQAPLLTRIWKHKSIYMFIIPAFIFFIVFSYYPMYGLLIAFKDFRYSKGILGSKWVGLKWFQRFATDPAFWEVVINTLKISVMKLILTFPMPVILALMLNAV